jgi:hypothetical protein
MSFLLTAMLLLELCEISLLAQTKIAEGAYAIEGASESAVSSTTTATRWILYSTGSGGYHLESEIQNLPHGLRLIQKEELDHNLVPTSIAYELYDKPTIKPKISVNCNFLTGSISCGGQAEAGRVASSRTYKYGGNFWLWVQDLSAMDMPWLLGGALNMTRHQVGKATVATLSVSGSAASKLSSAINAAKLKSAATPGTSVIVPGDNDNADWEFNLDQESTLKFVGTETLEVGGMKVATKHYVLNGSDEPMNLWIAEPGILIRSDNVILSNYKQYHKLIPDIEVKSSDSGISTKRDKK